jgi:hypothetical protein
LGHILADFITNSSCHPGNDGNHLAVIYFPLMAQFRKKIGRHRQMPTYELLFLFVFDASKVRKTKYVLSTKVHNVNAAPFSGETDTIIFS